MPARPGFVCGQTWTAQFARILWHCHETSSETFGCCGLWSVRHAYPICSFVATNFQVCECDEFASRKDDTADLAGAVKDKAGEAAGKAERAVKNATK